MRLWSIRGNCVWYCNVKLARLRYLITRHLLLLIITIIIIIIISCHQKLYASKEHERVFLLSVNCYSESWEWIFVNFGTTDRGTTNSPLDFMAIREFFSADIYSTTKLYQHSPGDTTSPWLCGLCCFSAVYLLVGCTVQRAHKISQLLLNAPV